MTRKPRPYRRRPCDSGQVERCGRDNVYGVTREVAWNPACRAELDRVADEALLWLEAQCVVVLVRRLVPLGR